MKKTGVKKTAAKKYVSLSLQFLAAAGVVAVGLMSAPAPRGCLYRCRAARTAGGSGAGAPPWLRLGARLLGLAWPASCVG